MHTIDSKYPKQCWKITKPEGSCSLISSYTTSYVNQNSVVLAWKQKNRTEWEPRNKPIFICSVNLQHGEGNGNSLPYSYLENSMDRGAWRDIVPGVEGLRHDWAHAHTEIHRLESQPPTWPCLEPFGCCCLSVTKLCPNLYDPMDCSVPGSSLLAYLLESLRFISIELVMLSNNLILCCPLLLLPSVFPSIGVFFQWVSSSPQLAKIFELWHQPFQWIFRADFL